MWKGVIMSNLIHPELLDLVQERGNIWSDFDNAIKNRETLNFEGNKIKGVEFVDPITDSLSGSNIPPAELSAALNELKYELKNIDNIKAEMIQREKDIQDEKARIMRNKFYAIVAAIVVILILYFAL